MHRIGYALPEGFQVMALGTQTVFELANLMMAEPFYAVDTYALDGSARASTGLTLQARPLTARSQADTWLVAGTLQPLAAPAAPELLRLLDRFAARARRVAGLCTGAFVLADAGLLDGRRATTHWYWADALQQRRPQAQVEADRIYIADGPVWTSAGMTAEIDLALALVERTWAPRWRARWRTASSCTSAVRAANHNIRKCSGWRPSPTASSWRWNMRGATWRSRSASRNWPRRPS